MRELRRSPLETHHRAWLRAHPERTEEWLRERLADGFQVHHCDGNSANDHPLNLALVEGRDHVRVVHRHPRGLAELISSRYRWRDENREHYNGYQRDLMRRRRADARAGAGADQLTLSMSS
jgi:hypothetical protein